MYYDITEPGGIAPDKCSKSVDFPPDPSAVVSIIEDPLDKASSRSRMGSSISVPQHVAPTVDMPHMAYTMSKYKT